MFLLALAVGLVLALAGLTLMAVRHPASCPGQILVRIRMTHYRMFGGGELGGTGILRTASIDRISTVESIDG